jgi:hypothetical protein
MDELEQISTRYLLGELSEQEQAAFEERYFRDPQVFNQVLQVESELVDAYARGRLSTETRERFESSYLKHQARRQRVEFAKTLTTRIDENEEARNQVSQSSRSTSQVSWWQSLLSFGSERPKLRFAIALLAVLIVLSGAWIVVNNLRRQRQPTFTQAKQENQEQRQQDQQTPQQTPERQNQEEHTAQVSPGSTEPSPSPVIKTPRTVSLALTVGGVRDASGGPTQTLFIPSDTTQAQILLNLKDDSYPRYRASLQKIGGPEIFTQTNLRPRISKAGAKFVFTVRATQLTKGDYALTLSGFTPQGEVDDLSKSLFRVEKK